MDARQKRKILDCFNGNVDRDCDVCQAHNSRGGKCCFGLKWEEDDEQCTDCIHYEDCGEAMAEAELYPRSRRVSLRRTTPVSRRVPINRNVPAPAPRARPTVDIIDNVHETMLQRLAKDALWGAAEGALHMMHDFFRTRRWP